MLNRLSNLVGFVVCVACMIVGAKEIAKKVWAWKTAHDTKTATA